MRPKINGSAVYTLMIMFILLFASTGYPLKLNKTESTNPISSDSKITNEIMTKFHDNLFYSIYDWVTADCNDGVVTLKGWVHLPWLKTQLQADAQKVPGVKSIDNQIKYTFGPGRVGVRAARLIYSSPWFIGEAFSINPPVHIIVNNDIVILEGSVKSEVMKDQAEYLVKYLTDAFNVQNNLTLTGKVSTKNS